LLEFHYRSAIDIVAIKFKCCQTYYGGSLVSLRDQLYATRFQSPEDVAHDFLSGAWAIDAACFRVPRPIAGGVSHPTNLAWIEYRIVNRRPL
jgi:hypothetical protein